VSQTFLQEAQNRVGEVARKWTLDRLIDVGGMASVFEATHRNGNKVAIKVMHRKYAENADAKERFLREGYVANKVGHDNAVTVLDDDQLDDGTPFIVMELLEGHPLEAYVRGDRRVSPAQALYVADQVLGVLASAHDNGIIHRDIKPGNVFITKDGTAKVLDFGLARVLDPGNDWSATRTGTVIGTTSYMSPEQARGKREAIDHRTDIFAVGAMLFRCLTGHNLHAADNPMDRLLKAMTDEAPSLGKVMPEAPADLVQLVDKAMAFQKKDRWPDARAMQAALRKVYQDNTGTPVPSARQVADEEGWAPKEVSVAGVDDIHVSVTIEEPVGDSIFVEFSELDSGKKARYELRRKAGAAAEDDEDAPLSEVSVVFDED
jgi:serine/threonine-protein kinase